MNTTSSFVHGRVRASLFYCVRAYLTPGAAYARTARFSVSIHRDRVSNPRIEHSALLFIPLPVPCETVSNRDEILVSDNVKFYLQSSVTRRVCLIEFQQKVSPPRVLQLGIFLPSVHIFARKRCVFSASPPSLVVSRKFACTLEIGFKANPILSGFRLVREVCLLNVGSESTFTGREGKPVKALSSRPPPSFLRRLRFLSKGCKVFGTK